MNESVTIASDHGGFVLKKILIEHLNTRGVFVKELGPLVADRCDYPDFAHLVCSEVQMGSTLGILVCGTGIGMSMAANKHKGIRAAVVSDVFSARATRAHNDCNILCMGERVVGPGLACMIVDAWLGTEFEGGRHQTRIDKLMQFETNR